MFHEKDKVAAGNNVYLYGLYYQFDNLISIKLSL